MLYDETKHTKQQLIAGYFIAGIPLLFGFYMAVWEFGQIADKKAQNPDHLIVRYSSLNHENEHM